MTIATYRVKETFATIQGEGALSGMAAVFVRFAGCNLWSGNPKDRERDAMRNDAVCPRWCDTDFERGDRVTLEALRSRVEAEYNGQKLCVVTGGEPSLQLDVNVMQMLLSIFDTVAIETNGLRSLPWLRHVDRSRVWVTISPKTSADRVVLRGEEVKVVFPTGQDPESYAHLAPLHYVQPLALTKAAERGQSVIDRSALEQATKYVLAHPRWRLSYQLHKEIGLP